MLKKSIFAAMIAMLFVCFQAWGEYTLRMWVMVTEEERESFRVATSKLVEDFCRRANTEVSIEVELILWATARDRIAEALRYPEKAPDICQVGSTWVMWVVSKAQLEQLELVPRDRFVAAALESCPEVPGKDSFYAAPWFIDVRALYYNKQLYPDAPTEENWDWDVLAEVCSRKLEESTGLKKDFFPIAFSGMREWSLLHDTVPWIWGANNVADAVSFRVHLAQAYGNKDDLHLSRERIEAKFLRGCYTMIISGYWLIGRAGDYRSLAGNVDPNDIGILPIPAPAGKKPYTFVGGSNLVLFHKKERSGEKTQLAKDFINFILEPGQQVSYSKKARVLPAQTDALESLSKDIPHVKAFKELLENGRSYPKHERWSDIEFRLVKNLALVWDFASGLYTHVQDPETDEKSKKTLSQIITLAESYWAYIVLPNKES